MPAQTLAQFVNGIVASLPEAQNYDDTSVAKVRTGHGIDEGNYVLFEVSEEVTQFKTNKRRVVEIILTITFKNESHFKARELRDALQKETDSNDYSGYLIDRGQLICFEWEDNESSGEEDGISELPSTYNVIVSQPLNKET